MVLSPFEVNSGEDKGYAASSALAGTRTNEKLENLPNSISVMTQEFLQEVKSILLPGAVIAANTFSSSGLYPYESATYAAVFGKFYNLKAANRVIWAQNGPLAPRETLQRNSEALKARYEKRGIDLDWLLKMPSTTPDWPADAKILTDQFSPSNLLNAR